MGEATWEVTENGVMVFRPASVTIWGKTQESVLQDDYVSGYGIKDEEMEESNDHDEYACDLPSLHGFFSSQTDHLNRGQCSRSDSPVKLAESEDEHGNEEVLKPMSKDETSGALISTDSFLEELRMFADSVNCLPSSSSPVVLTPSPQSPGLELGYDSDRTDFLENRSPAASTGYSTGRNIRYFTQISLGKSLPVRRRLNFGPTSRVGGTNQSTSLRPKSNRKNKSKNPFSLERLRSIERVPRHPRWTPDERELLCVMYKWYDSSDKTAMPRIFNHVTGLDLRLNIISLQFNYIRFHGVKAFREYQQVSETPFNDPERRYYEIRNIINSAASELNIDLQQREVEEILPSGSAASSKSPNVRKNYKKLVSKASQAKSDFEEIVLRPVLGGFSVTVDEQLDDWEILTDAEDTKNAENAEDILTTTIPSTVYTATPASQSNEQETTVELTPHLAFRVWDAESYTTFDENKGFTSREYADKSNHELMNKVIESDGEGFMLYAHKHMSKRGNLSAFVSVTTSLIQALVYAASMNHPQIAVIDLNHPSLNYSMKKHHAAHIIQWLWTNGLKQYRYQGKCEYIIWANLPRSAIISHFPLIHLQDLATTDQICADFLNLQDFHPGDRTPTVASRLRDQNLTLSTSTARAMGLMAKTFGLDGEANLLHIEEFVSRIVDGWSVQRDIHALSTTASVFAMALQSQKYRLQDVMSAFCGGIEKGLECVALYARRGRPKVSRSRTV